MLEALNIWHVPMARLVLLTALLLLAIVVLPSIYSIGPTQVGLVRRRFGRKLTNDNPIAFNGEAGYQSELLMPGLRFRFWLMYAVEKFPWVQVPAGEVGVVIAQIGAPMPIGAKSAVYNKAFGNFADLNTFMTAGGQKGVQRPVLPPGTLAPIHPIAFLVIAKNHVFGVPVSPDLAAKGKLTPPAFGLKPEELEVVRITPEPTAGGKVVDMVGIVTTFEGEPLAAGDIASRLGGFEDMQRLENVEGANLIETILGSKNGRHNNYQDFQTFLDEGGKIGLQHDPLLYGAYNLNPFLIRVEKVPMLVVEQGQVAVIKAYVGLPTEDTSGADFKFGSLVKPGHRGIWQEPLRTGKYPINPRCYQAVIVPTSIITLNWADAVSQAHNLDAHLQQIVAKSSEGFAFSIDLQVQIHIPDTQAPFHIPDTQAPYVISMVGSIQNLVNEVLQAAVGNHFRNKLQSMPAVRFIEKREEVQRGALDYVTAELSAYKVETKGVFIQDVVLPQALVKVLTEREIANQEVQTFKMQRAAQEQRIETEKARGTAEMQVELARSAVGVEIQSNRTTARKAEADGEASFIQLTGQARGAEVEAVGMAKARAYKAQVEALGQGPTAVVNAIDGLSRSVVPFMPKILVTGGNGRGALEGLAATIMGYVEGQTEGPAKKTSGEAPAN